MKTFLTFLLLNLMVASCGKKGTGANPGPEVEQDELSSPEEKVVEALIKIEVIEQKNLIKTLLNLKVKPEALKDLDRQLTVQCVQASGLCYFGPKESK
jgi:hypothetical protein